MVNPEFKHKESGQRFPTVELMLGSNDVTWAEAMPA